MSGARIDPAVLQRRVQALPALPQAALDALAALRDDGLDLSQCADALARDPALAAGVLRLANSPFYGVAGRVVRVHDAVLLLGRHTVASLATAALAMAQFTPPRAPGFDTVPFWRHGIATALAAQALAGRLRLGPDLAFTAGLLHDIGWLALATLFPQQLEETLAARGVAGHDALGVDHARLGGTSPGTGGCLARWRRPSAAITAPSMRSHP